MRRAFDLLHEVLADDRPSRGVRELAAATGLAPSTCHRVLTLLAIEGMITNNGDGTYSPGVGLMRLAWKAAGRLSIRDVAKPVLEKLVNRTDETASLGLYEARRRRLTFALVVDSAHPLRYVLRTNEWEPAYLGASGAAICAFLPPPEVMAILADAPYFGSADELAKHLSLFEAVREEGYALSKGERLEGAVGIASPIFGVGRQILGTVALSIPEFRFNSDKELHLSQEVKQAAADISHRLGTDRLLIGE